MTMSSLDVVAEAVPRPQQRGPARPEFDQRRKDCEFSNSASEARSVKVMLGFDVQR